MAAKHHAFLQAKLSSLLISKNPGKIVLTELSISTLSLPNPAKWRSEWQNYVKPDLAVYTQGQIDMTIDRTVAVEIPDLVIEILSPQQYISYLVEKTEMYFEMGVKSAWVVVPPSHSINVFLGDRNRNRPYSPETPLIRDKRAGVTINIKELFSY